MTNNTPKTKIPPLMWAFTIVFALASAVGGYVIGERDGQQNALNQMAEQVGGVDPDGAVVEGTSAGIPDGATPGTDFSPVKANSNGFFDATIHGPSAPITSQDEIDNAARRDPKDPMAVGALDAPVVIA